MSTATVPVRDKVEREVARAAGSGGPRKIGQLVTQLLRGSRSRRRRPSQRNQSIYEEVVVRGRSCIEAGNMYRLSQRRVRAICRQVERWQDECELAEREAGPAGAERRGQRRAAKRRLEYLYGWALEGLRTSSQTLTHLTVHQVGHQTTDSQTVREELHFNVQWLKVAKGTVEKLLAMSAEDEAAGINPLPVARGDAMLRMAACLKRAIRRELARGGKESVGALVEQIVRTCAEEALVEHEQDTAEVPPKGAADASRLNYSIIPTGNSPSPLPLTATAPVASASAMGACDTAPDRNSGGPDAERNRKGIPNGIVPHAQPSATKSAVPGSPSSPGLTIEDRQQRLLTEFDRVLGTPLTREQADEAVTKILARGVTHAAMQGYDAKQRAVLIAWQQLMKERHSSHHAPHDEPNGDSTNPSNSAGTSRGA